MMKYIISIPPLLLLDFHWVRKYFHVGGYLSFLKIDSSENRVQVNTELGES